MILNVGVAQNRGGMEGPQKSWSCLVVHHPVLGLNNFEPCGKNGT